MNSFSIRRSLRLSAIEYRKWLYNPRMIISASLFLFIWNFVIVPMFDISEQMNLPLNALEPFIAAMNSESLGLVCPAVFIFLIADYPKIDPGSLFLIHRMRKREWAAGQIVFLLYAILSYLATIALLTLLIVSSKAFLSNTWSNAVVQYSIMFPEKAHSYAALLITPKLFNQISVFGAALSAFALVGLYLLALALVLLLFHLLNLRRLGTIFVAFIIAAGSAVSYTRMSFMWAFPMPHTIISFHFTDYFRKPIFPVWGSFIYLSGFCAFMICLIFTCVKRAKFDTNPLQ